MSKLPVIYIPKAKTPVNAKQIKQNIPTLRYFKNISPMINKLERLKFLNHMTSVRYSVE